VQNINPQGAANPSIFGSTSNVVRYDGVDVMAPGGGTFDYPNYDMMEEFQVQAVGVSAEVAGFQGGSINLILKSGSNTFKGTASDYFVPSNSFLANNTPNEALPRHIDFAHDIGWTFGGPIKKDTLWFQRIDPTSVFVQQPFIDTFNGVTQTIMVYNRTTPASQSILTLKNLPDLRNSYKSFMIEANKRMHGRWQAQFSYQWQRQLVEDQGSDPNSLINAYARGSNDNTHAFRGLLSLALPYDIQLGARYFANSGFPYARLVNVTGLGQGTTTITAQAIGSYEYPVSQVVSLRVDKAFRFDARRRLRLAVDLLNALNNDAATSVRNNSSSTSFPFGTLYQNIEGRKAQLAVRLEF
jgi:hypothetical protein